MEISVWQQFSSNHSGSFRIVGVFDTPQDAEKAAAEIKSILEKIQQWHDSNPEKAEVLYDQWAEGNWPPELSEIEKELAKQYQLRWPGGIDWFGQAKIHILLGHILAVDSERQVDWGPEPFDQIINRLGGYGLVAGSDIGGQPYGKIIVRVSCEAPDMATAEEIVTEKTTQWESESVRSYQQRLSFEWDYYEGIWDLEELVNYLKQWQCTRIEYLFYGTHHTVTKHFTVNE